MKFRRDRRSELPVESILAFYPRYWFETAAKQVRWIAMYWRLRRIYLTIKKDPAKRLYTDLALTPVAENDTETLEMFKNEKAQAFVSQQRRLDKIAHSQASPLVPDTAKDAPALQPNDALQSANVG
jgi:hypothetical protein